MDKCLLHIHEKYTDVRLEEWGNTQLRVIIYGDLGGRFDHSFGIINSLTIANQFYRDLVLVGSQGSLRVLPPGETTITRCDSFESKDGVTCGLIPLGGWTCNHVTTTGLKWNLNDSTMQFGYLVSSSNCMISNHVTVDSACPLIWTLTIHWSFRD